MLFPEERRTNDVFHLAIVVSLLLHVLALLVPAQTPHAAKSGGSRLTTRLAPRKQAPAPAPAERSEAPQPLNPSSPPRFASSTRTLTRAHPNTAASAPTHLSSAQEETNTEPQETGQSLAQRALAMAHEMGRQSVADDDGTVSVERVPNSPQVSPFSIEMYLDSLVTKLNRSASFVRRGQRRQGYRNAAVQLRLNPNGTIKTFHILNAGDQHDEIAYVQALVEQAAPYSPFPPDLVKSAKSLAITICIVPTHGGGGFGFSRNLDGRSC